MLSHFSHILYQTEILIIPQKQRINHHWLWHAHTSLFYSWWIKLFHFRTFSVTLFDNIVYERQANNKRYLALKFVIHFTCDFWCFCIWNIFDFHPIQSNLNSDVCSENQIYWYTKIYSHFNVQPFYLWEYMTIILKRSSLPIEYTIEFNLRWERGRKTFCIALPHNFQTNRFWFSFLINYVLFSRMIFHFSLRWRCIPMI